MTDDYFGEYLVLLDYYGSDRNNPRPFLLFNWRDGTLIIADDYETGNDPTARDFGLSKEKAIKLAAELLRFAMEGTPSNKPCADQGDVENALRATGRL